MTEIIEYGFSDSPVGPLLVAQSSRGCCFVDVVGDRSQSLARLQSEFEGAELVERPQAVAEIAAAVSDKEIAARQPVDARGTAFQREVWRALRGVPAGSTATYAQVAEAIGRPSAVRAVAGAIARNPVALLVPCHRVIRSDGSLGGYRWGRDLKARLIARERRTGPAGLPAAG